MTNVDNCSHQPCHFIQVSSSEKPSIITVFVVPHPTCILYPLTRQIKRISGAKCWKDKSNLFIFPLLDRRDFIKVGTLSCWTMYLLAPIKAFTLNHQNEETHLTQWSYLGIRSLQMSFINMRSYWRYILECPAYLLTKCMNGYPRSRTLDRS